MGQKLRGFVGQSLAARKRVSTGALAFKDSSAGDTSYKATASCIAFVFAWGGGAGGSTSSGTSTGGGGGSGGFKKVRLTQGATLSWTAGAAGANAAPLVNPGTDGGDTTVSAPGVSLVAGGGKASGAGGSATGPWDVARSGNAGNTTSGGAGGSSASLADLLDTALAMVGAGGGGNTSAGSLPGGGGGGDNLGGNSFAGAAGRVLVFVFKANPGIGGGAL